MILVTLTIDGTDYKISDKTCALESLYKPYIIEFDSPRLAINGISGGVVEATYGSIKIRLDFFVGALWPPAQQIDIKWSHTETTEAAAVVGFEGIGEKTSISADGIIYELYANVIDKPLLAEDANLSREKIYIPVVFGAMTGITAVKIWPRGVYSWWSMCGMAQSGLTVFYGVTDVTSLCTFNGDGTFTTTSGYSNLTLAGNGTYTTLAGVAEYCANIMGLTYDGTSARSPSPTVACLIEDQQTCLSFLADICKTYTHFVKIVGTTLYLCDMGDGIADHTLSGYQFLSAKYERASTPICRFVVDILENEYSIVNNISYGSTVSINSYHTGVYEIIAALRLVTTYYDQDRLVVEVPITSGMPVIGDQVTITDSRLPESPISTFFVRSVTYQYQAGKATLEGEGWCGSAPTFCVPAGLIVGYELPSSGIIADAWSLYPYAMDKFLVGAGSTYDVGDTGGSTSLTLTTSTDGLHTGTAGLGYWATSGIGVPSTIEGLDDSNDTATGVHSHEITGTYDAAYQNICLIQAQTRAAKLPSGAILFAKTNTAPTGYQAWGNTGSRFFKSQMNDDTGAEVKSAMTCGYSGAHVHGDQTVNLTGLASKPDYDIHYHIHTVSNDYTADIKRAYVAAYKALSEVEVAAGLIGMWDDLDNIPDGWALCDGTNSTPDLRNYYICNSTDATQANAGTNSVQSSGSPTISTGSHDHIGDNIDTTDWCLSAEYHNNSVSHSHTATGTMLLPYYAIGFIQYTG